MKSNLKTKITFFILLTLLCTLCVSFLFFTNPSSTTAEAATFSYKNKVDGIYGSSDKSWSFDYDYRYSGSSQPTKKLRADEFFSMHVGSGSTSSTYLNTSDEYRGASLEFTLKWACTHSRRVDGYWIYKDSTNVSHYSNSNGTNSKDSEVSIYKFNNLETGKYSLRIDLWIDVGWSYGITTDCHIRISFISDPVYVDNTVPTFSSTPDILCQSARISPTNLADTIYVDGVAQGTGTITYTGAAGKHTYYAKDKAGNQSQTGEFYIVDKAPTATRTNAAGSSVSDNGYTNSSSVKVNIPSSAYYNSYDIITYYAKRGSSVIESGTSYTSTFSYTYTEEGTYYVKITNAVGLYSEYTFTIDRAAPTGTLNGVTDGGYTNSDVRFTWSESSATARLNGSNYTSNNIISAERQHTIILTDKAGNSTTYTFTIDKTAPLFDMKTGSTTIYDGAVTNQNVHFTWTDNQATMSITRNGTHYTNYYKNYFIYSADYNSENDVINDNKIFLNKADCVAYIIPKENLKVASVYYTNPGTLTVYPTDLPYAVSGSTYKFYRDYVFVNDSTLNTYINNTANNTLCLNIVNHVIKSEGFYAATLVDLAGNKTVRNFTIGKTAPTGTLSGVTNGGITKNNVSFTWSESGATATLNGTVYNKGSSITTEGSHTIVLKDQAGNSTTYTFTIDKTAPEGTLTGVTNGGITNNNVNFTWSEADATATLNGVTYVKGSTISSERQHTIILTDRAGNSTTYTFTISKTAPSGSIFGLTNIEYSLSNDSVYVTWTDSSITAKCNSVAYTKNTPVTLEGIYTIILYDAAGNTTSYTFTIDKTPPSGTLTGVTNGGITNKDVRFTWSESGATATLNGINYVSNTVINSSGKYTIILTDRAGNSTTYAFEISLTAPEGTLTGLTNETYKLSNKDVKFSWTDSTASAIYQINDGKSTSFTSGTTFASEGKYTIILTDKAGNSTTYTFEIDKTPPSGTLNGVTNGGITNKDVRFTWSESGATATLNGNNYISNTSISSNGSHTIILTDRAGNSTTYTFQIKKDAPTGFLYLNQNVNDILQNGGITSKDVYFTWSDNSATATLDGKTISQNSGTNIEGAHTIILMDLAGNSTTYTFTINKTPPSGTLNGVTNGGITKNNVSFTWIGSTATATLNGSPYLSDSVISYEDFYELILTNNVGVSSYYTFEIDKTPPSGTLNGVTNGGITKGNIIFSWSESDATATLNGINYQSGTTISVEGQHTIILTDRAGNSTTYTFEIDKTPPEGVLNGVANGGKTNSVVSFTWSESGATATINGSVYLKEQTIRAEDKYTIILTDRAGNSATYTFEINLTPPEGFFTGYSYNTYSDVHYFKENMGFSWTAAGAYAQISENGGSFLTYTKGATLSKEATYRIRLYDEVGNLTTYDFVIDKTPFLQNKTYIMDSYICHINKWYEACSYRLENNRYIENIWYSFTNYDDALRYGINRERQIVETQIYQGGNIFCTYANRYVDAIDIPNPSSMIGQPFYIYKDIDNSNRLIAYFKESNLELAINRYAERSIKLYYLPRTPSQPYPGDLYISSQQIYRDQIYIKNTTFSLPYSQVNGFLYINGILSSYNTFLNPGINYIREVDYAGNETTYTVFLDIEAPQFQVVDNAGTVMANYESSLNSSLSSFYFDKQIRLSLIDNYDENCLLTITFEDETFNIIGSNYELSKSGIYEYTIRDIAGNSKSGRIYLSLESPIVKLTENLNNKQRLESFDISIVRGLSFVNISNIAIQFKGAEDIGFTSLVSDNFGTEIKENTYSYRFVTNGEYIITVVDNYMREVEYCYTFIKEAPVGTLFLRDNTIFQNGGVTNQDVYFDWSDQTCIAYYTFNAIETEYPRRQYLSTTGIYTIRLEDAGGNCSVYTFEIKKTIPNLGRLYYVNEAGKEIELLNKSRTNYDVYFTYDRLIEPGATVRYSMNNSEKWSVYNGEAISNEGLYVFQLIDRAGNVGTYTFTIDKTAPIVTIKTTSNKLLNNNSITNMGVSFIWDELNVYATLNKEPYSSGTVIRTEGTYVLYVEDSCGNFANYYVTIDTTPPDVYLEGVSNDGVCNNTVTVIWAEQGLSLYINDKLVSNDTILLPQKLIISDDGNYEIKLVDLAANVTILAFTIDKSAPIGTLTGVANGGITNSNVRFTWSESGATATLNGINYASNTLISAEDKYTIILTDRAGNSTTYTFEIDKTPPSGTLNGVTNGGYTNTAISFTWSEENCYAVLNGIPYESGNLIDYEKTHIITLTDRAGNTSTYSFTIDKSAPIGTLTGVANGGITNTNVNFSWIKNGATATLNEKTYVSNTAIRDEGFYTIVLTDRSGNVSIYTFTIDKTAPEGTLIGINNQVYNLSKGSVSFTWSESGATATLNDSLYTNGAEISIEGKYTIILTDRAGNNTTYTFEIDKTAPTGTLSGISNLENMITNLTTSFKWDELTAAATLNGATYISATPIRNEGKYTIILTDRAGNSTTYTFEIDLTAPEGTLIGLTNNEYKLSNDSVVFSWTEEGCYATYNSIKFENSFLVTDEEKHTIILTDRAGNSTTYTFEIDLTAPEGTLIGLTNTTHNLSNKSVSFSWIELGATATLNGINYAKGQNIITEDKYTIILTDRAGNSATYTFEIDLTPVLFYVYDMEGNAIDTQYFNKPLYITWAEDVISATINGNTYIKETKIEESGIYYFEIKDFAGNISIYHFSINTSTPLGLFSAAYVIYNNILYFKTNVSFSWTNLNYTATLNGNEYLSNTIIRTEGRYFLILSDREGNSISYEFEIDKTAPEGVLNGLTEPIYGLSNESVYLTWDEENLYAYINGTNYINGQHIESEGTYSIILYDLAGNNTTYTFEIDKKAPSCILAGVNDGGITNTNVKISWEENNIKVTLNDKEITNNYTISSNGYYVLVLKDRAGNYNTCTFTIDKTAPTGTLSGVTNGGVTNINVFFTWEGDYSAALNGNDYENGTEIKEEGYYIIILINNAGTTSIYEFEIDLTAPEGTLTGLTNTTHNLSNKSVSFSWIELGATATLNGNPYVKQTNISSEGEHTIILTDRAGNTSTYSFTIDKTAPIGFFEGLTNSTYYLSNDVVYFSWYKQDVVATLNDNPYFMNDPISEEGIYVITLIDLAGNISYYYFEIDKTAPTGTLSGVDDGGITNDNVSFTWSESTAYALLNSAQYIKGTFIQNSGFYWIELFDLAGNRGSYEFEIDKTPPVGELEGLTNEPLGLSNANVSFSWTEEGAWALLDGEEYNNGDLITAEGKYTIIIFDSVGNQAAYTFTIDKTAPEGTLTGLTNTTHNLSNKSVSFSWIELGATATLNGTVYNKGSSITTEGSHTIVLKDQAGNSTTYTFTIDKTAPEGTLTGVTNETYSLSNESVYLTWENENYLALLNGENYESGSEITIEGLYTIILTDLAGNTTSYTFTIDKTPPASTGIENGITTNKAVRINWAKTGAVATLISIIDGEVAEQDYSKDSPIRGNGEYTVIITDRAGNVTTISFTIYAEPPKVSVLTSSGQIDDINDSAYLNLNSGFSIDLPDCIITLNGEEYLSGSEIKAPGKYDIVVEDAVGNKIKFSVRITAPADDGANGGNKTITIILITLISLFTALLFVKIILSRIKKQKLVR